MMRPRLLTLFLVVLVAGCATPSLFECPNLPKLARDAQERVVHYDDGTLRARGSGLPETWDDSYRDFPVLRAGRWTYWYRGGQKWAEVTYSLTCYLQCCVAGPCPQVRDYPSGTFTLWYPSGAKLAEGSFHTIMEHVDTNCEGGDKMQGGMITSSSLFWREDGSPLTAREARDAGLVPFGWR